MFPPLPPTGVTVAVPLLPPLHDTGVDTADAVNASGWPTIVLVAVEQFLLSVTTTV